MTRPAAAFLALWACAGGPAFAQTPPHSEYWLRVYPKPEVGEIWRLSITVKDFQRGLDRAVELLNKRGQSVLPLQNMAGSEKGGFQQLSYRLPADAAPKVLAALQKLGEVEDVQKRPAVQPGVREEVQEKLAKLRGERERLGELPATRSAVAEIVAHLESVEKAEDAAKARVLLNLQLQAKKR
ncbi:MAG: hypothetical protein HY553_06640 [Elusimicrobia bacterium]|nr:hypothetical protein [Elusimicrobiota bacterium]